MTNDNVSAIVARATVTGATNFAGRGYDTHSYFIASKLYYHLPSDIHLMAPNFAALRMQRQVRDRLLDGWGLRRRRTSGRGCCRGAERVLLAPVQPAITVSHVHTRLSTPMSEEKTERFQMRVAPSFLATIDEWRRKQRDLPPRAEAIRRLVELGLSGHATRIPRIITSGDALTAAASGAPAAAKATRLKKARQRRS